MSDLLKAILVMIFSAISIWLLIRIEENAAVRKKREHMIRLSNWGNLTSVFRLSVASVEQIFSFQFLLNDIPLIPVLPGEMAQSSAVDRDPAGSMPTVHTVHTQPVKPGDTLSLKLRVEASRWSQPVGTYTYTLSSQQLPHEILLRDGPPISTQGILDFPHAVIWHYRLAAVASLLVIAAWTLISALILSSPGIGG
jgi:hypothetical protein